MNRVTVDREMCKECEYCMTFCPKKLSLQKALQLIKKVTMQLKPLTLRTASLAEYAQPYVRKAQ